METDDISKFEKKLKKLERSKLVEIQLLVVFVLLFMFQVMSQTWFTILGFLLILSIALVNMKINKLKSAINKANSSKQ